MNFCIDQGGVVVEWVRQRVPMVNSFGKCSALGIVGADGLPMAGAVYHEYHPEFGTIMISLAADNAKWATPGNIRAFLAYPFEQLGVQKLRAAVLETNQRSIKLTKGVGFVQEAKLMHEFGRGRHALMFRMSDAYFLKRYGKRHGQINSLAA